jgi:hypothetical protein
MVTTLRPRLASLLILFWCAIQVSSLLQLGFGPFRRPIGWVLVLVFPAMSVGLLLKKTWGWARACFLTIGALFVVFYAYAYFFWKPRCTESPGGCDTTWILLQPLLVVAALLLLLKPLAFNGRLERSWFTYSTNQETANSRLNWSVVYVSVPVIAIAGTILVMHRPPSIASKAILLLAVVGVGSVVSLSINLLRPRYERSDGRTRRIYDFLLRQFPPPD